MARRKLALALLLTTPLGLLTTIYEGPAAWWVRDYGGGMLYVFFWILVALLIRPDWPPGRVTLAVLTATCALETLQLWHPPLLQAIRDTFLGAALLGRGFQWLDIAHYVLAAGIGYLATTRFLTRRTPDS